MKNETKSMGPQVSILHRRDDTGQVHLVDQSGLVLCRCYVEPWNMKLLERVTLTKRGRTSLCEASMPIYKQLEKALASARNK